MAEIENVKLDKLIKSYYILGSHHGGHKIIIYLNEHKDVELQFLHLDN